ncbi:MAG: hypothetical protein KC502_08355 [Myxococcales bacterium]|nr:hypothetical protein [Myxococcales bacterium]
MIGMIGVIGCVSEEEHRASRLEAVHACESKRKVQCAGMRLCMPTLYPSEAACLDDLGSGALGTCEEAVRQSYCSFTAQKFGYQGCENDAKSLICSDYCDKTASGQVQCKVLPCHFPCTVPST